MAKRKQNNESLVEQIRGAVRCRDVLCTEKSATHEHTYTHAHTYPHAHARTHTHTHTNAGRSATAQRLGARGGEIQQQVGMRTSQIYAEEKLLQLVVYVCLDAWMG